MVTKKRKKHIFHYFEKKFSQIAKFSQKMLGHYLHI
jgi:hypothetical protein